jgi:creatinine amidohydrolase
VAAYVRSLVPHGFEVFVLLSSHGGNFAPLEVAARRLREEYAHSTVRIVDVAGGMALREMMRVMVDTAAALGAPQDVDAIHADVCETSVMMALHPHLVDAAKRARGYLGRIDTEDLFRRGLRAVTPNGILGDATGASPEIGRAVLERLTDHLVAAIQRQLEA